jgi:hypothetical protein
MHGIAGIPAEPIKLTINRKEGIVQFEVDDEWMKIITDLWSAQSPQGFGSLPFAVVIRNDESVLKIIDYDSTLSIGNP